MPSRAEISTRFSSQLFFCHHSCTLVVHETAEREQVGGDERGTESPVCLGEKKCGGSCIYRLLTRSRILTSPSPSPFPTARLQLSYLLLITAAPARIIEELAHDHTSADIPHTRPRNVKLGH